ncbi:MAG: ROK family protein [Acidimicrobiales bacterium]
MPPDDDVEGQQGAGAAQPAQRGARAGTDAPVPPLTLAIDIGGTGLKASVLDANGSMVADRVRVPTRYPMPPEGKGAMIETLVNLVAPLPAFDRVSAGFPGMVRRGHVLSAPHFVTVSGPGSKVDEKLVSAWADFDMAGALRESFGKPARVANDADVQGAAVVSGNGLELVVTLGTGFGTAMFLDGRLLPHLEIAHQPFRKTESYNEQLGEKTRKQIGDERWNTRVRKAVVQLDALVFFDHLHVGGGNARRVRLEEMGEAAKRMSIVDNSAGILGGIRLWEGDHLGL